MKLTEYSITSNKFSTKYVFALISDLHGDSPAEIIKILDAMQPDVILAPGDIFEPLNGTNEDVNKAGFELLSAAAKIAPTFFSSGNHEIGGLHSWRLCSHKSLRKEKFYAAECMNKLKDTGVVFLDDAYTVYDGIVVGGLCSGIINEGQKPKLDFLREFCDKDGPKILLCHHPEYYKKYLCNMDIDLIVSGHAHGGQWRFFGRGVFAPGQGLFPKYTSGVHENRLVISKGLKKGRIIPRIFNSPEVIKIVIDNSDKAVSTEKDYKQKPL